MKNKRKNRDFEPENRESGPASVAFIHLKGLFNEEPTKCFDAIQELHARLKAVDFPKGVSILSASAGAIVVAPDDVFSRTTGKTPTETRLAIHHFLNDIFDACRSLPLRIGVTHGMVEFFGDVKGGTYIGEPINIAARIATTPKNAGLLFEHGYCAFRKAAGDNDSLRPDKLKKITVQGKGHDRPFVCFGPVSPPTAPKDFSGFRQLNHRRTELPAFIVAIDLPRFSSGGKELLSKRFRAFVDAAQTLLAENVVKEWHYSPGGDGGIFVFPGIKPGPAARLILSMLAAELAKETTLQTIEASVQSRIGAHYDIVQLYVDARNQKVPTGHGCFLAELIAKDIAGGSIACSAILKRDGGHSFTPNQPTSPIEAVEVPVIGTVERYLLEGQLMLAPAPNRTKESLATPRLTNIHPPDQQAQHPDTKAMRFVSQARAIYLGKYERDQLTLAGKLARKATHIDPSLSSAWASRARVAASFILRGWTADSAAKKRAAKVQSFANLALALSSRDEDVHFALGVVAAASCSFSVAEASYRRALAISPNDSASKRALAFCLLPQGRIPEVFSLLKQTADLDKNDPLPHFDLAVVHTAIKNYPTAWQEADAAIRLDPIASAVLLKAWLAAAWRENPEEMRQILDQLKPEDRNIDEAVYFEMWCGLLLRKPSDVLAASQRARKAYIKQSYVFSGPTKWHTALAYQIANEKGLADDEWRAAENEIRKHLHGQPANVHFRLQLATTLAWLGEQDKAAREIAQALNQWKDINPSADQARDLAGYYAALGDADHAIPLIRRALQPDSGPGGLSIGLLRLDPRWDKLRQSDGFIELVGMNAFAEQAKLARIYIVNHFGADKKWVNLNDRIWSVIAASENHSFGLSDVEQIASVQTHDSGDLLAVLGLLARGPACFLKMQFRDDSNQGAEVQSNEFARKLTEWWKHKSLSDAQWHEWASHIKVNWVPTTAQEAHE